MNSFFEAALRTDTAKKAYGTGIVKLLESRNLDSGIDAMFEEAENNGALDVARFGLGLDILQGIFDLFKK